MKSDLNRFLDSSAKALGLEDGDVEMLLRGGIAELYTSAASIGIEGERLATFMAEYLDLEYFPYIDPETVLTDILPAPFSRANLVLALRDPYGEQHFVLSNPFDMQLRDTLNLLSSGAVPSLGVTHPESIRACLGTDTGSRGEGVEIIGIDDDREEGPAEGQGDGVPIAGGVIEIEDEPSEETDTSPIKYIADKVLFSAVREGASDIHLEPKPDKVVIRYRIDGDMTERFVLSKKTGMVLLSRFKVLGGLDIAERRKPQDGALAARIARKQFKMRLATTSTPDGESLIIRLLNLDSSPMTLEQLGMTEGQSELMREVTGQTAGAIIVVGPTGSGKSTTLYSLISHIDISNRSLMTIEDPVEYTIPYANQQQVNEKAGVTFEALLRSAVRQDPDIVYLGEIRDPFSAKTTMDLASTGHMTFATLHSSNSASSVSRLERLGVSREDMADSVLLIESQRLLKKLCIHCRMERPIRKDEAELLASFTDDVPRILADPVGCPRCRNGYSGRQGVYELLRFNPEIISIIRSGSSVAGMRMAFKEAGQYLMSDHGIDLVREQVLSLGDLYRTVLMEELRLTVTSDGSGRKSVPTMHLAQDKDKPTDIHAIEEVTPPDPPDGAEVSDSMNVLRPFERIVGEDIRSVEPDLLEAEIEPGKSRILVVDDDPVLRSLITFILSGTEGYDVVATGDGVDAMVTLSSEEFDLIISDVDMPNLNGFQLLEVIRNKGIGTPVVFVTGRDAPEDEIRGYELGAEDYIRKPIHKKTLLMRISRILQS